MRSVLLSRGGRPRKTGNGAVPVSGTVTLKELGLTKNESSHAQWLARMADARPDLWESLLAHKISMAECRRQYPGRAEQASMKGMTDA